MKKNFQNENATDGNLIPYDTFDDREEKEVKETKPQPTLARQQNPVKKKQINIEDDEAFINFAYSLKDSDLRKMSEGFSSTGGFMKQDTNINGDSSALQKDQNNMKTENNIASPQSDYADTNINVTQTNSKNESQQLPNADVEYKGIIDTVEKPVEQENDIDILPSVSDDKEDNNIVDNSATGIVFPIVADVKESVKTKRRIEKYEPETAEDLFATIGNINGYSSYTLPSLGCLYSEGSGLSQGKIWIRPMCASEEKLIYNPFLSTPEDFVDRIVSGCCKLLNKNTINVSELLNDDLMYIIVAIRSLTYGNIYPVSYECPQCLSDVTVEFDLNDDIEKTECDNLAVKEPFSVTLPQCGVTVKFRVPRVKDNRDLANYLIKIEKDLKDKTKIYNDAHIRFYERLILGIVGKNEDFTDRVLVHKFINALSIRDLTCFRNAVSDAFPYGINMKVSSACPSCGSIGLVDLPTGQNFFSTPMDWDPTKF